MLLLHVVSKRSSFIVSGTVPPSVDIMGRCGPLKKIIKYQTFKNPILEDFEPTRITPIYFKTIALTTWAQHIFMPFYPKHILEKFYHNYKNHL